MVLIVITQSKAITQEDLKEKITSKIENPNGLDKKKRF